MSEGLFDDWAATDLSEFEALLDEFDDAEPDADQRFITLGTLGTLAERLGPEEAQRWLDEHSPDSRIRRAAISRMNQRRRMPEQQTLI